STARDGSGAVAAGLRPVRGRSTQMHRGAFRHHGRHTDRRHHHEQVAPARRTGPADPVGRRCHGAARQATAERGGSMTDVLDLLLQPEVQADPYPTYARLRRENPVSWSERGRVYVLSRHADVRWAFNSPDLRSPEPEELSSLVPKAKLHRALGMLLRTLP